MPSITIDDLNMGVTFTPTSGSAKHSYTDYSLYMAAPTYSSKKRKEILVDIPYVNGVLDFSDQYGGSHYQAVEVTYRFVSQYASASAMRTGHTNFESFCWGFAGSITDDYGKSFTGARCTSFTATPHPGSYILEIEVTFRANSST